MTKKFTPKTRYILSIILIIVGIISLYNTNSNPTALIERIFKPINLNGGTFHYAGIISIILIYYGLKGIYKYREYRYLGTGNKRIVWTIIVLLVISKSSSYVIKTAKSLSKGLNSIYYHRESNYNELKFIQREDGKISIKCSFELENCSKEAQEFYIKVLVPETFKKHVVQEEFIFGEDEFNSGKKLIIDGKEKKNFQMNFTGDREDIMRDSRDDNSCFIFSAREFEFILYNEDKEVKFIKGM